MSLKLKWTILPLMIIMVTTGGIMAQTNTIGNDHTKWEMRDQIPEKYRWNLEAMYPDKKSWEMDFTLIDKTYIPKLEAFKGTLTNGDNILKCLQVNDEASRTLEKLFVYIHMKFHENQADNDISEMSSRSETLNSRASAASAFVRPELLELSEETLRGYAKQSAFADYAHFFDALIRQKPHTLSKPEEELLANMSDFAGTPEDINEKLRISDMVFPKIKDDTGKDIQLSPGVYQEILENKDRDYRKRAYEGMYQAFGKSKNTFAATLSAQVKKDIFYAKARKYGSSIEASLDGDFIPAKVYENLVQSVNANLKPLHKYTELRRKVLGLDKLRLYDLYLPLVDNFDKKIPYEDAKKMLRDGLAPLGANYLADFDKGLDGRWIDVYETKNKHTGGYNWGCYDSHPYILMNYNDTVDSMLTLAHEMGHAMNSYYTYHTQKYINSGIPIFTAEVASTANETLMMEYLIKNAASEAEKLFYLNQLAENIRGTVYTQVMYSEFEKLIHERVEKGDALSAKSLNEIWKGLMDKYFGPAFEADELAPLWWSRIPHFFSSFYVYKYATSLSASYSLMKEMLEGKDRETARRKYLEFLQAGSSDYPVEVLKKAGVDMTSPKAVDDILSEFSSLVDQMEQILKKEGKIK